MVVFLPPCSSGRAPAGVPINKSRFGTTLVRKGNVIRALVNGERGDPTCGVAVSAIPA